MNALLQIFMTVLLESIDLLTNENSHFNMPLWWHNVCQPIMLIIIFVNIFDSGLLLF